MVPTGLGNSREGDNIKGKFSFRYAHMKWIETHLSKKRKYLEKCIKLQKCKVLLFKTLINNKPLLALVPTLLVQNCFMQYFLNLFHSNNMLKCLNPAT